MSRTPNSEDKRKHLEFIQNIIARMNTNSFMIKGWCITLISALFALAAKDANIRYALISFIVLPVFWVLDGFFIATERRYRDLFKEVADKTEDEEIDYNLNAASYENRKGRTWVEGIFSQTLIPLYVVVLITIIIVLFIISE